jgi:transketolase
MVASGSEVSTLIAGSAKLREEGIKTRVVSVPSEALFFDQSVEYRNEILPEGIVRYGLTSGLPMTLQTLVGLTGKIHGLDHFGYSAPFKVLDEKFGFSGQTVYNEVKEMLGR